MLYLAGSVPAIFYMQFSNDKLIEKSSFVIFTTLFTICNIISMIIFILNIFDISLKSEINEEEVAEKYSYDPEITRENSIIN
jgi:hypothetical protein